MKIPRHQLAGQIRTTLEEAFDQIRLARAAELARSRRLLEAAALLMPGGQLPESASSLDLLARIAVKLEDFQTAKSCWQYASQIEPENPAHSECLRELELAKRKAELRQKIAIGLSAALLGAALAALGFVLWQEMTGSGRSWLAGRTATPSSLQPKAAPPKNTPAPSPSKNNETAPLH